MENITILPKNEKELELLKQLLERMRINFRTDKLLDNQFSAALQLQIDNARKEKANDELLTVNSQNLWESI